MNRLLILAPALLLAFPAIAQEAPAAGYQNLWCHFAFTEMANAIPPLPAAELEAAHTAGDAATPQQLELLSAEAQIKHITDGTPALLEAGSASYTGAGFTPEALETAKTELNAKVKQQVAGDASGAEFTFEACLALLPAPAEAPAQ